MKKDDELNLNYDFIDKIKIEIYLLDSNEFNWHYKLIDILLSILLTIRWIFFKLHGHYYSKELYILFRNLINELYSDSIISSKFHEMKFNWYLKDYKYFGDYIELRLKEIGLDNNFIRELTDIESSELEIFTYWILDSITYSASLKISSN